MRVVLPNDFFGDEIGMLAVLGSKETVDDRSECFARNIRHEGAQGSILRLAIPHEALLELVDVESIDWDNPLEMNVWAGDRMLAFDLVDREERTLPLENLDSEEEAEPSRSTST